MQARWKRTGGTFEVFKAKYTRDTHTANRHKASKQGKQAESEAKDGSGRPPEPSSAKRM